MDDVIELVDAIAEIQKVQTPPPYNAEPASGERASLKPKMAKISKHFQDTVDPLKNCASDFQWRSGFVN